MKKLIITLVVIFSIYPICVFAQKKDILVIESYHGGYPWDASYKEGLTEVLGSKYNLIFFEMDTKRLPKSEYKNRNRMAWDKYKEINPVLVVLGDDNALKYLGPKFANTNTPVVYLGINNNPRSYGMVNNEHITGVLERPLLKRSIKFLDELLKIKKVLILFDAGTTAKCIFSEIFSNSESEVFGGIQADIKLIKNYTQWQKSVLTAKK